MQNNMYIIKMMSGDKYSVTESEYQTILNSKGKGDVFIPRIKSSINPLSISNTYPEYLADEIEERKEQKTGILHDGTRVKRLFGEWVDADNSMPDDNGKYSPVRLDSHYYPEVAMDCVPTERQFQAMEHLQSSERLLLILKESKKRIPLLENQSTEPLSISQILSNK